MERDGFFPAVVRSIPIHSLMENFIGRGQRLSGRGLAYDYYLLMTRIGMPIYEMSLRKMSSSDYDVLTYATKWSFRSSQCP